MTMITTNMLDAAPGSETSFLDRVVMPALLKAAKMSPSYRRLEYYNAKSDAELAEMGLTRADVPAHVLGARFYA